MINYLTWFIKKFYEVITSVCFLQIDNDDLNRFGKVILTIIIRTIGVFMLIALTPIVLMLIPLMKREAVE